MLHRKPPLLSCLLQLKIYPQSLSWLSRLGELWFTLFLLWRIIMSLSETIPIGLDFGAGAIKLYARGQGIQLLSQVAFDSGRRIGRLHGLERQKRAMLVGTSQGDFYVGENAHDTGGALENMSLDRFAGAPENGALMYGAMAAHIRRHGAFDAPVYLTVGLPLEALSGEDAPATVDAVQRWIKGQHSWQVDGHDFAIEVAEARITSQPVGGLFDFLLDGEGQFAPGRREMFNQEVGIISVGMSTTELLVVRNRVPVQRFTAGSSSGVRRLLELVDGQRLYSLGELDTLLRAGRLDVSKALPIWQEEIVGRIDKQWGTAWRRFAAVLLLGGGVLLLKDSLPYRFAGKAVIPDDPVLSIARGLWKLGLFQLQKKG